MNPLTTFFYLQGSAFLAILAVEGPLCFVAGYLLCAYIAEARGRQRLDDAEELRSLAEPTLKRFEAWIDVLALDVKGEGRLTRELQDLIDGRRLRE